MHRRRRSRRGTAIYFSKQNERYSGQVIIGFMNLLFSKQPASDSRPAALRPFASSYKQPASDPQILPSRKCARPAPETFRLGQQH
jgi:hypothetical protein